MRAAPALNVNQLPDRSVSAIIFFLSRYSLIATPATITTPSRIQSSDLAWPVCGSKPETYDFLGELTDAAGALGVVGTALADVEVVEELSTPDISVPLEELDSAGVTGALDESEELEEVSELDDSGLTG